MKSDIPSSSSSPGNFNFKFISKKFFTEQRIKDMKEIFHLLIKVFLLLVGLFFASVIPFYAGSHLDAPGGFFWDWGIL